MAQSASGLWIRDPDDNIFLDFTEGIAVCASRHCHPEVVRAIKDQADRLLHMSGTDFCYTPQIALSQEPARLVPPCPYFSSFSSFIQSLEVYLCPNHGHR